MTEVVSVKFKTACKNYFFSPEGIEISTGDWLVVETAKGMEMAQCSYGNHFVEDTAVVQPLRPVIRIATDDDFRVAAINKGREAEAFDICKKKIEAHDLDMKLINVECNFEGNKITFFFTSEGRVDFRELVKDLASVFRTRIELRQIGIRDETKMLGGIGICGRPYCCHEFLDEFRPVSTKMAKIQSLSLNPSKISGSCGRLMCCLRYEQEAYEDLLKRVPKQGSFVETKDGFGTAVQVNLLRQTVKVKLDDSGDDNLHLYKANELCSVPGGRPPEGETPEHVFEYVEEKEEETAEINQWAEKMDDEFTSEPVAEEHESSQKNHFNRHNRKKKRNSSAKQPASEEKGTPKAEETHSEKPRRPGSHPRNKKAVIKPSEQREEKPKADVQAKSTGEGAECEQKPAKKSNRHRRYYGQKTKKPVKNQ